MLDDFFIRALLAGFGLACISGPLGCFVIWRNMAYLGDTIAHSALLGLGLAALAEINPNLAVFAVATGLALILVVAEYKTMLATDAILGVLSHTTLALGLVLLSVLGPISADLFGFLFGNILAVTIPDLATIVGGGGVIIGLIIYFWRALLATTVSVELAQTARLNPMRMRLLLMLMLAATIALALKLVGVLLITALLIIPASAARALAKTPETMALYASLIGMLSVALGLYTSLWFDTPSGPSIVIAAACLLILGLIPGLIFRRVQPTAVAPDRD